LHIVKFIVYLRVPTNNIFELQQDNE